MRLKGVQVQVLEAIERLGRLTTADIAKILKLPARTARYP